MTETKRPRRPRNTGSLLVRRDRSGQEVWHARLYVGGKQRRRTIGLKRLPGTRIGLTRAQAEAELRRLIAEARTAPPVVERIAFNDAADRYLRHLEATGRKRSTLQDYESTIRVHLTPFFVDRSLDAVSPADVEAFIAAERRNGKAPKSIRNWISVLGSIFAFACRRGWTDHNPVAEVDRPRVEAVGGEVRFLDQEEVEALLRAVPDDRLGATDRVLYLTAAMTGLRQGELFALRWRDVDWPASRVRVRRSYVRGEMTTPKSRRGTRSVPLADRLAGELERHFRSSVFQGDDDLVFAHPSLGGVLDRSQVRKRFKAALRRAGVREVRFHDLRHTFGTRMAAAGAPMRTLQEWLGHADFKTTLIYADYQPGGREVEMVNSAFQEGQPRSVLDGEPLPAALDRGGRTAVRLP